MDAKAVIFLTIILLFVANAHAIGISPARVVLNFTSSMEMASRIGVLNNEDRAYEVQLYVTGDLAQYVTFNEIKTTLESHTGKYFDYSIRLPSWLAGPKKYDTRIGAVQTVAGSGMLGAVAGVEAQLWINVPDTGPRPSVVYGELPPRGSTPEINQTEQPGQPPEQSEQEQPGGQPEQPPVQQETAQPVQAQLLGYMLLAGGSVLAATTVLAYMKFAKPNHSRRKR
jgi:hypothetical protein